ncbi:hypothetical protein MRB53_041006 [Persea americana]|nr:hypothetical protein MRB53_041006 [Persea americana]
MPPKPPKDRSKRPQSDQCRASGRRMTSSEPMVAWRARRCAATHHRASTRTLCVVCSYCWAGRRVWAVVSVVNLRIATDAPPRPRPHVHHHPHRPPPPTHRRPISRRSAHAWRASAAGMRDD